MALEYTQVGNQSGLANDYLVESVPGPNGGVIQTVDLAGPTRHVLEDILFELIRISGSETLEQTVQVEFSDRQGYQVFRLIAAATTNATTVTIAPTRIRGWFLYNAAGAVRYLKLYSGFLTPTVGTDKPVMTIGLPSGAAANVEFERGIEFKAGLGLAITTGQADSDATACAAGDVVVNLLYD